MLRVTTGCVTCRIRRVKCDEEKPHCKRCKTTGRKCEGYVNAPLSRKGLGPTVNARLRDQVSRKPGSVMLLSLDDVKFVDERESQCFDFFRSCSVPNTNLFVTDNFWSRVLLQATPAAPSIKHGILALGALHRHFETGKQADQDYAIHQYAQAMRHMTSVLSGEKKDPSTDYNILLMSIIIFHCFESHSSSYTAASLHLQAGKRLLEEANRSTKRKTTSNKATSVIDEVTRTLHRLDVHALTYQEASAPYDWPKTLYGTNDETMPMQLDGIDHARDVLMALFKRSAHVSACELSQNMGKPLDIPQAELASRRLEVSADLTKWKRLMLEQLHRPGSAATYPSPYSFILFESYYTVAVMNLAVSATGLESTWDLYISQCAYLVKNLAKLFGTRSPDTRSDVDRHVSYDLGIIAPLFWIAIKCREPLLRREAIAVLSSAHRKEGKWSSFGAAAVAQAVIDFEEEELGSVLKAADIPEARRVHLVEPKVDPVTKFVEAGFWRRAGASGAWSQETRQVRF